MHTSTDFFVAWKSFSTNSRESIFRLPFLRAVKCRGGNCRVDCALAMFVSSLSSPPKRAPADAVGRLWASDSDQEIKRMEGGKKLGGLAGRSRSIPVAEILVLAQTLSSRSKESPASAVERPAGYSGDQERIISLSSSP